MRSTPVIATTAALAVLVLTAIGLVLYDNGRENQIAKGITVNGVDIGELTAGEARARLGAEVAAPLQEPVRAKYDGRAFRFAPARADVHVDVEATVQQALDRSRDGNVLTRSVRGLTGGSIDEELDVAVSYDRAAVRSMVERVAKKLNQEPVDADVEISVSGVAPTKARPGREVAARRLRRAVTTAMTGSTYDRTVRVRARTIKPEISTREVTKKYPAIVVVDRSSFQVKLYEDLELAQTYTVAIGAAGYDTPAGRYAIQTKQVDPYWHVPDSDWAGSLAGQVIPPGPSNPLKARWMGVYNGAGFHGTDATYSLGSAASHGCIRMAVSDVIDLYDRVDVGTPVYIA